MWGWTMGVGRGLGGGGQREKKWDNCNRINKKKNFKLQKKWLLMASIPSRGLGAEWAGGGLVPHHQGLPQAMPGACNPAEMSEAALQGVIGI